MFLSPRPLIAFSVALPRGELGLCIWTRAKNRHLRSNWKRGSVGSFSATLKPNPTQRQFAMLNGRKTVLRKGAFEENHNMMKFHVLEIKCAF